MADLTAASVAYPTVEDLQGDCQRDDKASSSRAPDPNEKFKEFRKHFVLKVVNMTLNNVEIGNQSYFRDILLDNKGKVGWKSRVGKSLCSLFRIVPQSKIPVKFAQNVVTAPSRISHKMKADKLTSWLGDHPESYINMIAYQASHELCRIFDYQISNTPFNLLGLLAEQAVNNIRHFFLDDDCNQLVKENLDIDFYTLVKGVVLGNKKGQEKTWEVNGMKWKLSEVLNRPGLREVTHDGSIVYKRTPVQQGSWLPTKEVKYGFRGPLFAWDHIDNCYKPSAVDKLYSCTIADSDVDCAVKSYVPHHDVCSAEMMTAYVDYLSSLETEIEPKSLNKFVYEKLFGGEIGSRKFQISFRPKLRVVYKLPQQMIDFRESDLMLFQAGHFQDLQNAFFHSAIMLESNLAKSSYQGDGVLSMHKSGLDMADVSYSDLTGVVQEQDCIKNTELTRECKFSNDLQPDVPDDVVDGLFEELKSSILQQLIDGQGDLKEGQLQSKERQEQLLGGQGEIRKKLEETNEHLRRLNIGGTIGGAGDPPTMPIIPFTAGGPSTMCLNPFTGPSGDTTDATRGQLSSSKDYQYDFVLIYDSKDQESAMNYHQQMLTKFGLRGCLYDDVAAAPSNHMYTLNVYEELLNISRVVVLYYTPNMSRLLAGVESFDDAETVLHGALYKVKAENKILRPYCSTRMLKMKEEGAHIPSFLGKLPWYEGENRLSINLMYKDCGRNELQEPLLDLQPLTLGKEDEPPGQVEDASFSIDE